MDNYDPKLAARVWQRVQGSSIPEAPPSLIPLIAGTMEDAAVYLLLSRRFRGRHSALLKQLAQQAHGHCACLKGIHRLRTGTHAQVTVPDPGNGSTEALLRRCYSRALQAQGQYRAAEQDPDCGHVFSRLARESQTGSRLLLQLLGSLPEQNHP